MTEDRQHAYGQRSLTQKFLLCKTDVVSREDRPAQPPFVGLKALSAEFPRMLTGKAFIEEAMFRLDVSLAFGILLVRLGESAPAAAEGQEHAEEVLVHTARILQEICQTRNGMWGLIEPDLFGCFFPDAGSDTVQALAEAIRKALAEYSQMPLTMGLAVYPTAHFARFATIENARKALAQAALSGSGNTAVFDVVTLNISGDRLYQEGDVNGAVEELRQALILDSSNVNVHNSLGVCYGVLGADQSALEEFETASMLDPDEPMAVYNAGLIHMRTGDKEKALECLLRAGQIGEDLFEVAFQTGKLYYEMREFENARRFFEKTTRLNPKFGAAFRHMGECCMALDRSGEALVAYRQAVKLNPNDATSLSVLGALLEKQGKDLEIALIFCRHSVEISPDNGLFRQRLGRLYLRMGQPDDALKEFEQACRLGCKSQQYIEEIQNRKMHKAS